MQLKFAHFNRQDARKSNCLIPEPLRSWRLGDCFSLLGGSLLPDDRTQTFYTPKGGCPPKLQLLSENWGFISKDSRTPYLGNAGKIESLFAGQGPPPCGTAGHGDRGMAILEAVI